MRVCYECFHEFEDDFAVCPHCGQVYTTTPKEPIQLLPGTLLANRYVIGLAVGSGGFGIVYRAYDKKLQTVVAVKEFFISRLMTRAQGAKEVILSNKSKEEYVYRKERFLAEAKNMAKFGTHRNIPNVFEYFEENGTAYIVMELLQGMSLTEYLNQGNSIDIDFAVMVANEVGNALSSMHKQGIVHCDVAPDNIFLCSGTDFKVKLMDFGAAKLADATDTVIDIILKPGYSPTEQYDNSKNIGPWTDIYALGATLYVMLTGVKPDESTNRKIEDTLVPPMQLNDSLTEDMNNTVMKAMAIEQHLRFKDITSFLKALNGERRVVSVEKEKKRRKMRRFVTAAATVLAVGAVGLGVYQYYSTINLAQRLKPADISVWYCAEEDSDENKAMRAMADNFEATFEGVKIELVSYGAAEYESAIKEAAAKGDLPTLFESTGLDSTILDQATELTEVFESEQFKTALFLDQYVESSYSKKQLPIAIDVPVACVITNGPVCIDYESDFFTNLDDFGTNTSIAVSNSFCDLVEANFGNNSYANQDEFLNPTENTAAVLLTSTREINDIKQVIPTYSKTFVYPSKDQIQCQYTYFWSLGGGDKNQKAAGERLMAWMLGNVYQSYLMISECNDGYLPVNERCFTSKIDNKNLKAIEETYKNFVFH